ncbi:transcriptional regulator, MarR family [Paenibacillus curdlanolyticus YK9]|uniref:Transcriptional regulator, MarR family n=1 Tax=Paenibacillus curdlanolyticus YK9 TaxID=717606 RepID=E0I633_9BACL|nr:MarR family transcriptional regulator [Paenibacillus curdlanolyticus]EFM12425.1 transcriptional regulator, MarR family [Paenibacillus curdlanolyticus YK9]
MPVDHKGLERSVGFMTGMTYRKLSALLQNRLKPYEITPEQWSILYQIDRADGLIQKEIAERAGKDKPTTTRILDLLEEKGLIYKKAGTKDRRSFLVYITDKGRQMMQETLPIEKQVIAEVKSCMTTEEYDTLIRLISKISAQIDSMIEDN